jgi:hypothetical protein
MASIDLVAGNRIEIPRTVNTFDNLPDVPQSRFELNVSGGPGGILFNFRELCDAPSSADATFSSHSGKTVTSKPELEVEGCASALGTFSLVSKRVRVNRAGKALVRIRCVSGRCAGKLGIERRRERAKRSLSKRLGRTVSLQLTSGRKRTVRVVLKRATLKRLRRQRRLAVRVVFKTGTRSITRSATLIGPRRRR